MGSTFGFRRSLRRTWKPIPYSYLENPIDIGFGRLKSMGSKKDMTPATEHAHKHYR